MTLHELALVLALLGLLLSLGVPAVLRAADRAAVVAAREEVAAAVATARRTALARGGARLTLTAEPPLATIEPAGGGGRLALPLTGQAGVTVAVGSSGRRTVRFDALGLGRAASVTVTLRRRAALAGVSVSAYGRVRRW